MIKELARIPLNLAENTPIPGVGKKIGELSRKDASRVIFASIDALRKDAIIIKALSEYLTLQNWPVEGEQ